MIEETETWDEACAKEQFWIAWIGTRAPWGYNLTDGGEGTVGCIRSEETRAKMSAAKKGRKGRAISQEQRTKQSANMRGNKHLEGHIHSVETRAKMSAVRRGNKHLEGHVHSAETRARMSATHKAIWAKRKNENS